MKSRIPLIALLTTACGSSGGSSDSAIATVSAGPTGGDTGAGTTDVPTSSSGPGGGSSTDGEATSVTGGGTGSSGGGTSTSGTSTGGTSTGVADSGTQGSTGSASASSSGGESSTGEAACVIADVEDTLGFGFKKTINLGDIQLIEAGFYNSDAAELVFFGSDGHGRRFTSDGQPLGDVMAPAPALPALDGAGYDPVNKVALLINQACQLVEADPVTMAASKVTLLAVGALKIGICSGVAVGLDGDLYITSWKTHELVRLTRDGQDVVARVDLLALGLPGPESVSLIAGSENFLVLSLTDQKAAIVAPDGAVVVPAGAVGKQVPPLKGGMLPYQDALVMDCSNGHVWACDNYSTKCHEFAPMGGDKEACACTIPP